MTLWLYSGLIALLGVERLYELRLSRRNAAKALAAGAFETGTLHYRFMTLFHGAFLISCLAEPWLMHRAFPGMPGLVALAFAGVAQGLRYWSITALGERWNTRLIVLPGAAPVMSGPYRFIRHPNYLAVVIELVAVPLIHGSWITALLFSVGNAVLLRVRIRAEERALGASWRRAFVGRARFLPGVRHG